MDTKLKKFKYSIFTKILCWVVAICAFVFSFSFIFKIGINCFTVGPEAYFKGDKVSFYDTNGFENTFISDFYSLSYLSRINAGEFRKYAGESKEEICSDALNKFLDYKSEIIKSELEYAVNNWDDTYYIYDDSVEVTFPSDYVTEVYINDADPESIKTAQKILVNAEGREFLLYESLVRDEAFGDNYSYNSDLEYLNSALQTDSVFSIGVPLSFNESQAKKYISEEYDKFVNDEVESRYSVSLNTLECLESRKNLKYYVVDFDGMVYSNINNIPKNLTNYDRYILVNGNNFKTEGFDSFVSDNYFEDKKINVLCVYFDDSFAEDDVYGRLYEAYKVAQSSDLTKLIVYSFILLAVSIIFLVVWLKLVGYKNSEKEPKLLLIDKIPVDVYFLSLFAIGYTILVCVHDLVGFSAGYSDEVLFTKDFYILSIILISIFFAFITLYLSTLVKIKRCGQSIIRRSLIYMVLHKIYTFIKSIVLKIKKLFDYKPKVFKVQVAVAILLYFLINVFALLAMFFCVAYFYNHEIFVIGIGFAIIVFNLFVAFYVIKYVNNLDQIIVASSKNENVYFDDAKVNNSLLVLADNIAVSNDELKKAVAEAVKNEQMKTQLITNVSHDLKTPLTSLINYSDLLSKCDIDDEKAVEYIGVINNQSIKLKRLIEDLIEASKVSTGNVQIIRTYLNLSELLVQAIVEFSPDFEKNRNEIKFTEPDNAPVVFADSIKTYRIISNLFSNAKKYSAPNTRVYATVYEDEKFGYFEIKNISKEPLNISPEMLTERFIRGDESRSKEGNGLGLSIAKDLCVLQNGELMISIDGDLFKATVKLPKSDK